MLNSIRVYGATRGQKGRETIRSPRRRGAANRAECVAAAQHRPQGLPPLL